MIIFDYKKLQRDKNQNIYKWSDIFWKSEQNQLRIEG